MEQRSLKEEVRFLKALADETRLSLVEQLLQESLCVGDLCEQSGKSFSTISFHLSKLESAGVLVSRKEGKCVYYEVTPDAERLMRLFHAKGHKKRDIYNRKI